MQGVHRQNLCSFSHQSYFTRLARAQSEGCFQELTSQQNRWKEIARMLLYLRYNGRVRAGKKKDFLEVKTRSP